MDPQEYKSTLHRQLGRELPETEDTQRRIARVLKATCTHIHHCVANFDYGVRILNPCRRHGPAITSNLSGFTPNITSNQRLFVNYAWIMAGWGRPWPRVSELNAKSTKACPPSIHPSVRTIVSTVLCGNPDPTQTFTPDPPFFHRTSVKKQRQKSITRVKSKK